MEAREVATEDRFFPFGNRLPQASLSSDQRFKAQMAKKITIADLFADDQGMILVAEDAVDGSHRHISDVANGTACECICFGCGKKLITKKGGDPYRVAHHFAHRAEHVVIDCVPAGEAALHIRAKEIIAKHCRVTLNIGSDLRASTKGRGNPAFGALISPKPG